MPLPRHDIVDSGLFRPSISSLTISFLGFGSELLETRFEALKPILGSV